MKEETRLIKKFKIYKFNKIKIEARLSKNNKNCNNSLKIKLILIMKILDPFSNQQALQKEKIKLDIKSLPLHMKKR